MPKWLLGQLMITMDNVADDIVDVQVFGKCLEDLLGRLAYLLVIGRQGHEHTIPDVGCVVGNTKLLDSDGMQVPSREGQAG